MRTVLLLIAGFMFVATAACGGDDDAEPTNTVEPTSDISTATVVVSPTPTPLPASAEALTIVSGTGRLTPTVAEFLLLPQTEVELPSGEKVSGVSIGELATLVDARDIATVTVEGQQIGVARTGFMRRPLSEVAEGVIIYISDAGQLTLASPMLPELEWLTAVRSVTFE